MSSLSLDEKLSTVTSIAEATTPTPQNIDLYAVDFCPINVASCGYRVHAVGQYCPPPLPRPCSHVPLCVGLQRFQNVTYFAIIFFEKNIATVCGSGCSSYPTCPPRDCGAEYCNISLCLSVRDHTFGTTRPIFTNFFVHVSYGGGSLLLWRRSDTLYTSGFVDDVISQGCSTSPPSWSAVHTQPWTWL